MFLLLETGIHENIHEDPDCYLYKKKIPEGASMNSPVVESIYQITTSTVTVTAISRCIWLVVGIFRMIRLQKRSSTTKWGWIEFCTFGEVLIFFVVTYVFFAGYSIPPDLSVASLVGPILGALLALAGLIVSLWSFSYFPKVSAGHYVEKEHTVVSTGPYGLVRHPIYFGVFLIWFSLAVAFLNLAVFLFACLYVIPVYIFI